VTITDPALVAAATLADRYISRFLPDKAIDLIDEAGARMGIRRMTAPPDLREFDEKIAAVRRDKESAVDAQDFERAAHLRDSEKQRVLLDLPGATADVPGPTPGRIGWRMVGMVRPGPSHGPALPGRGDCAPAPALVGINEDQRKGRHHAARRTRHGTAPGVTATGRACGGGGQAIHGAIAVPAQACVRRRTVAERLGVELVELQWLPDVPPAAPSQEISSPAVHAGLLRLVIPPQTDTGGSSDETAALFANLGLKPLVEITLVWVLFSDAARIRIQDFRHGLGLYVRLLAVGLPLTVAAEWGLAAWWLLPGLGVWSALLVGAALAPTDAALGLPVVTNPAVPAPIRRLITVESGLNDGIATPVVMFAIAGAASAAGHEGATGPGGALLELAIGAAIGIAGGALLRRARRNDWAGEDFAGIAVLALAVLAYTAAPARPR
jgi:hypothetical protein